jgi:hypothetical protein
LKRGSSLLWLIAALVLAAGGGWMVLDDAVTLADERAVWASGVTATRCMASSDVESWLFLHHWEGRVRCDLEGHQHLDGQVSFETLYGEARSPARSEVRYDPRGRIAVSWAVAAAPGRWRWIVVRAFILLLVVALAIRARRSAKA